MFKKRNRVISALLTVIMMAGMTGFGGFGLPRTAQAASWHTNEGYPYKDSKFDVAYDKWGYYTRNCTSWVAYCLTSRNGLSDSEVKGFGNAGQWKERAQGKGIRVDNTPAVGAVAWKSTHVAWVCAVNSNGTFDVEEYNYDFAGGYRHTPNANTKGYTAFIHFKDIGGSSPAPAAASSANIGNGYYSVQHSGSGLYFDIDGAGKQDTANL
ncbi:MAG: CHAP domain-containing protein, partial [Clostridiales bacterium]|nr:CHAP domain-containing protein [Clostridiales bacterium]